MNEKRNNNRLLTLFWGYFFLCYGYHYTSTRIQEMFSEVRSVVQHFFLQKSKDNDIKMSFRFQDLNLDKYLHTLIEPTVTIIYPNGGRGRRDVQILVKL